MHLVVGAPHQVHTIASALTLPARPRPLSHPLQGSSPLQVEKRDGPGGSYGQGRKQSMTLAQFLQRMAAGDDTLYLTTQQVRGHMMLLGRRAGTSGHFGHGSSATTAATLINTFKQFWSAHV